MRLSLTRDQKGSQCTMGLLTIDGVPECFTLEDVVRPDGVKIPGETAIPAGIYTVDITYSPRFKRDLPLLIGVKGFVGIRIHPGNTAANTEGCILVGRTRGGGRVNESVLAFDKLFGKLQAAKLAGQPITIEVR